MKEDEMVDLEEVELPETQGAGLMTRPAIGV